MDSGIKWSTKLSKCHIRSLPLQSYFQFPVGAWNVYYVLKAPTFYDKHPNFIKRLGITAVGKEYGIFIH